MVASWIKVRLTCLTLRVTSVWYDEQETMATCKGVWSLHLFTNNFCFYLKICNITKVFTLFLFIFCYTFDFNTNYYLNMSRKKLYYALSSCVCKVFVFFNFFGDAFAILEKSERLSPAIAYITKFILKFN